MLSGRVASVLLVAAAAATLPLLLGTTVAGFTWLVIPAVLLTFAAARLSQTLRPGSRLPTLLFAGAALLAIYSILSGRFNGLSDEPYSTPAYAQLGLGMYSHPVSFTYAQYGRSFLETSYDVYLPLLTFVQVPGLDYRWVALGAWAATFGLVRSNRFAAVGWASPWIATLAANGQNDFVPFLALTLALAGGTRRGGVLVQVIVLGLKQFANVIVLFYHLARKEFLRAAVTVVVTVALLAPFLLLDPGGVWCHVLIGDPGTACQGHPWTFFVFKRNYWLYPTWVGLLFFAPLSRRATNALRRVRGWVRSDASVR
ncbi:MAG: hypothetical protein L3K06_04065 [Thermoplasmata archaeon]|nr:hypothetical protein [Thermoplasmata archaeon]